MGGGLKKQPKNRGKHVILAFVARVIVRTYQLPLKYMPLGFARPLIQTKERSHPSELLLQADIILVFMRISESQNEVQGFQKNIELLWCRRLSLE